MLLNTETQLSVISSHFKFCLNANHCYGWYVYLFSFAHTFQSQLLFAYWTAISAALCTWYVYLWQQARQCFHCRLLALHATSASTSVWHSILCCQECLSHRTHYLQLKLRFHQYVLAVYAMHQTSNTTPRKAAVSTFGHFTPFWHSVFCARLKWLHNFDSNTATFSAVIMYSIVNTKLQMITNATNAV